MIVMLFLFTNPLFFHDTYLTDPDSYTYGLDLLLHSGGMTHVKQE